MPKIRQTHVELLNSLKEQVELLMYHCESFDQGRSVFAKHIAMVLRVLLHTKDRGNTLALLDQLGLRKGRWRSVAEAGHPRHSKLPCGLIGVSVSMKVGTEGYSASCFPRLRSNNDGVRRVPFSLWWTEPVAYNARTQKVFSRMDIVRSVTDTDGGAHVDHSLDESYVALRDGEFLSVRAVVNQRVVGLRFSYDMGVPIRGAVGAAIRTIAHETLLTLQEYAPQAFVRPYVWKTI